MSSALPADCWVRRLVRAATGSGGGYDTHEAGAWLSFRCRLPPAMAGDLCGGPAYVVKTRQGRLVSCGGDGKTLRSSIEPTSGGVQHSSPK